jgi:hypothetical protein
MLPMFCAVMGRNRPSASVVVREHGNDARCLARCCLYLAVADQLQVLMNQIRPIVAFLSFAGFFLAAVLAFVSGVWGESGHWGAAAGMGMIAFYFLLCFLSCLSFVRNSAMISMAVLAHVILAALLAYDLITFTSHNIHIELILAPIWLLFVALFAVVVAQRLEGSR